MLMAPPSSSSDNPSSEKPQIELASDDDWKNRVKAEDARLDQEANGKGLEPAESSGEEEPAAGDDLNLPPASLFTLLQMLSTQSIVALGMIPGPNGQATVQLPVAKHFIDLLTVLEQKCQGNLTADEQRFLEGTLHELRMAYVDVSGKRK